ncbi:hypothetical protein IA64_21010 [Xanthomonas arboricola pv. celebensis]|nr:hypothetical protein IA64_21010 [Xanthomonas arboricola pv. celebensis]
MTGLTIKLGGGKADIGGRVVCVYCTALPTAEGALQALDARLLQDVRNNDKFIILLWSAP